MLIDGTRPKLSCSRSRRRNAKLSLPRESDARYVSYRTYSCMCSGGTFMALPFDLKRLQSKGGPIPIIEGIMRALDWANRCWGNSLCPNRMVRLYMFPVSATLLLLGSTLALVDRATGQSTNMLPVRFPAPYSFPQLSPDGKRLAVTTDDSVLCRFTTLRRAARCNA